MADRMWVVRAGQEAIDAAEFPDTGVVGIGRTPLGDPRFDDAGRALLPLRRLYWPLG